MVITHHPVQAACPLPVAESLTPHADPKLLVLVSCHGHGCGGGTLIQACHCPSMLEVDPHGQLSMVVVGAHCVSWWL